MKTAVLETKRLVLRPLTINDAQEVYKNWTSDKEVARYMMWDVHENIEQTMEWLKMEEENYTSDTNYTWGFVLKETGELIGSGGLVYNEGVGRLELGYNIMKKYWKFGLTTEACETIMKYAVEKIGGVKFICSCARENVNSKKVMRKLGFVYHNNRNVTSFSWKKEFNAEDYYLEYGDE